MYQAFSGQKPKAGTGIPEHSAQKYVAKAALARATQLNSAGEKDVVRTITSATGEETFVHTTYRAGPLHTQDSAALHVTQTKSLKLSPGGQSGQWGEGAYAYEGKLADETKNLAIIQFTVPKGTAIEKISIPGDRPIIRLVPAEGNTLTIVNPIHNLANGTLTEAAIRLKMVLDFLNRK